MVILAVKSPVTQQSTLDKNNDNSPIACSFVTRKKRPPRNVRYVNMVVFRRGEDGLEVRAGT